MFNDKIEKQVLCFEKLDKCYGMVICSGYVVKSSGIGYKLDIVTRDILYNLLSGKLRFNSSMMMIRRDSFENGINLEKIDREKMNGCHGTPSPRILDLFLNQYNFNLDSIKSIDFREKTNFNLKSNQKEIDRKGILDKYSMAFLYGISYTDKCYSCPYARTERISDITLGDSWGSDLLEEEQRKGISLVLCQTKKGKELLSMSKIYLMNANVRKSIESNHQLRFPSKKPQKRAFFFNEIKKGKSFNSVVRKCYPISSFKQFIKSFIVTVTGREE